MVIRYVIIILQQCLKSPVYSLSITFCAKSGTLFIRLFDGLEQNIQTIEQ